MTYIEKIKFAKTKKQIDNLLLAFLCGATFIIFLQNI